MREVKQVIVVRKNLNMRKGKTVAQSGHGILYSILDKMKVLPINNYSDKPPNDDKMILTLSLKTDGSDPMYEWLFNQMTTKICLWVDSLTDLMRIYSETRIAKIPCTIVKDLGKTEFNNRPTITCCVIGPWWSDEIDKITGGLPLL